METRSIRYTVITIKSVSAISMKILVVKVHSIDVYKLLVNEKKCYHNMSIQ